MFGIRKRVFGAAQSVLRPAALLGAGSEAPAFDLEAHDGSRVRSADLEGVSNYVLVFYPGDKTPGCTNQLRAFSDMKERFAGADAEVFGVNAADRASHASFVEQEGYAVRLLVDEGRKLAEAYQTARPGVPVTFRSVFVVDKKGIVRASMKDYPDPEAVLRFCERAEETGFKGTGRKGRQLAPEISAYGIGKIQENDVRTVVLDVREAVDWRAGHIPGALSIPMDRLAARLGELPGKDVPIVIVDDQGLRSSGAARMLADNGWRKLYTVIDGMLKYKGPLDSGPDAP